MNTVFLNGSYMPIEEATISPLDRGFLFGDGVYEVIPSYGGKFVGFNLHIDRLNRGLQHLDINHNWQREQWLEIAAGLVEKNGKGNLGVYIQVSRGADVKRFHGFSPDLRPTVFASVSKIAEPQPADKSKVKAYRVVTAKDIRWQRCDIKSTALLGNVMHFQSAYGRGYDETVLFNDSDELTEASASNVYIVNKNVVSTPPLSSALLPGITREILLDILRQQEHYVVEERSICKDELLGANEVWLSSSSKELVPVVEIDGKPVGGGKPGDAWEEIFRLYSAEKFRY